MRLLLSQSRGDPSSFRASHSVMARYGPSGVELGVPSVECDRMPEPKVKERLLEAVRGLPEDATVEDAMERLYFLAKVEEGERQADAGQTMSHEEARKRVLG